MISPKIKHQDPDNKINHKEVLCTNFRNRKGATRHKLQMVWPSTKVLKLFGFFQMTKCEWKCRTLTLRNTWKSKGSSLWMTRTQQYKRTLITVTEIYCSTTIMLQSRMMASFWGTHYPQFTPGTCCPHFIMALYCARKIMRNHWAMKFRFRTSMNCMSRKWGSL